MTQVLLVGESWVWWNPVDPDRLRSFMDYVARARS